MDEIETAAAAKKASEELAAATKLAEEQAEAARKAAEEQAAATRSTNTNQADSDMIARLVQDRLNTELAGIKKSLDNAYKQRDDGLARIAAFETKEKEANILRLQEEGKHKEAYEIQLAAERAANAALLQRNVELSRDVNVREALRGYAFRNDKAADMAFREITGQLIQDASKGWIHRSGISVQEFCEAYSKSDEQSFLFKAKANSGSGTPASSSGAGVPGTAGKPKSLFAMSQAEVLKLAAEGKLKAR